MSLAISSSHCAYLKLGCDSLTPPTPPDESLRVMIDAKFYLPTKLIDMQAVVSSSYI